MKTPSGTMHLTMNHDDSGQPFEVFIEIGKAGSSIKAMAECIGRLISLIFRLKEMPPKERAVEIIEQLSGIGGARSVGFGQNKVLSLPDAISKALAEHYEHKLNLDAVSYKNNPDLRGALGKFGTGGFVTSEGEHRRRCSSRHTSDNRTANDNHSVPPAETAPAGDICPVCGQSSYVREEACTHCLSCGYSEC
jgi:ribonucleoside-diphosphate reductase alpha chain